METLVGAPIHWYVRPDEVDTYRDAGAVHVHPSGNLMDSRNAAIDDALDAGLVCVQTSDDLVKIDRKQYGANAKDPVTFLEAVAEILDTMIASGARLGGVAPTPNLFYASDQPKWRHFIVGDLIVVRETDLRFDTAMTLKEDYDYTCQHIREYGLVARRDDLLATYRHRDNAGGAVEYRDSERELENIRHLMRKWPGVFRFNPKRRGEVLMRWPL